MLPYLNVMSTVLITRKTVPSYRVFIENDLSIEAMGCP
jgi:hypothetical protein